MLNRGLLAALVLFGIFSLVYGILLQVIPARGSLITGALIVLALVGIPLLFSHPLKNWSDRAERGADTGHTVGMALKSLPDGYHVIHDPAFEGFNIDRVVIGPTAIFMIETKSHSGRISARNDTLLLNGRPYNALLDQTWRCTYAIRDLFQRTTGKVYPIHPVLCLPNACIEVRAAEGGVPALVPDARA